jgi:hypothetical protein
MTHPEMVQTAQVLSSKIRSGRPDLEPDFAFERTTHDVALMEAKGSFVHPVRDNPSAKEDLKHALNQIAAWSGMIAPTPAKSYAIGTYLRDESDSNDPSLIAYVDPPGQRGQDVSPIRVPDDWIRRGNYGAWLIGMGFPSSGDALRRARDIELAEQSLTVVEIGQSRFVVTFHGLIAKRNRRPWIGFPEPWFGPWYRDSFWKAEPRMLGIFLRDLGLAGARVLGIEIELLHLIETSLADPSIPALLRAEPVESMVDSQGERGFTGSIFPDGTLFGQINSGLLATATLERFRL